jgi:hypothetical protein
VSTAELSWDVFVPGDDLPRRITTDYVLSEGELVTVEGRPWLVERVVLPAPDEADVVPLVHLAAPHEPG